MHNNLSLTFELHFYVFCGTIFKSIEMILTSFYHSYKEHETISGFDWIKPMGLVCTQVTSPPEINVFLKRSLSGASYATLVC